MRHTIFILALLFAWPAFGQKTEIEYADSLTYVVQYDTTSGGDVVVTKKVSNRALDALQAEKKTVQERQDWLELRIASLQDELKDTKRQIKRINASIDVIQNAPPPPKRSVLRQSATPPFEFTPAPEPPKKKKRLLKN